MKLQPVPDLSADSRLARALFTVALMSDSKWRKLFAAICDADLPIDHMMVKFIDVTEPRRMRFPPGLACPHAYIDTIEFGPVTLRSMQWVEFAGDLSGPLEKAARFPLEVREGRTKVVGYEN